MSVERRYLDFAAERSRRETDRHFAVQVRTIALEHRVRLERNDDVEIAGRTAVRARLAFAGQTNPVVRIDAGGNLDRQRLVLLDAARAVACRARLGNDLAGAMTLRTRLLNREEPLRDAHLAAAVTRRTRLRLRARLRAAAVTRRAFVHRRNADLDLGAARRLLERQLEVVPQVGAT